MEIEKTRETSWKIQLKNKSDNIEITSVEISGEVRIIKLALLNNNKMVKVEMNKEEFFNFLSLISAFKDVVIGEDSLTIEEELDLIEDHNIEIQEEIPKLSENLFQLHSNDKEKNHKSDDEELNPEEWDPW
ncbi:MAG: hypothetical protein ACFFDF_17880 [Candidatus Odinarchaeota archaeon]